MHYQALEEQFGRCWYARKDAPVSPAGKVILAYLSPERVEAKELTGDMIVAKLTHAPCNGAAIGGLKVATDKGWFAARPSGTENVYKIYAESFVSAEHLSQIQAEAQAIVDAALKSSGAA
jgi:phosphoglucomutase